MNAEGGSEALDSVPRSSVSVEWGDSTQKSSVSVDWGSVAPTSWDARTCGSDRTAQAFTGASNSENRGKEKGFRGCFAPHLPLEVAKQRIQDGTLFAASFRVNARNRFEPFSFLCFLSIESNDADVSAPLCLRACRLKETQWQWK
ncbi:unnamed protein product [Closterium sp. Naga37s-1]|nr:unnamed protein product [Closterium sp. Naga37s-1]